MKKGIIYHSLGRRHIDQAALAARVAKQTNPWLGTAIFTDDVDYANHTHHGVFDKIIPLEQTAEDSQIVQHLRDNKRLASLQVAIADRSPFDQTLMVDSDTVILKDLSAAFDLLDDFDLMACVEIEHHIDTTNGWHAHGLKDNRLRDFYNAGVIFFNSGSVAVNEFMRQWKLIMLRGDDVLQKSAQDALNHLIGSPGEVMQNIKFSGSALKTREYNAFCRYWREIWDAGYWSDVRIVNTYMSDMIAEKVLSGGPHWPSVIEENQSDFGQFINRFTSGRSVEFKKRYAATAKDRNVSILQFANYEMRKRGESVAEDYATLFAVAPSDLGFDIVTAMHIVRQNTILGPHPKITQIGMVTSNQNLPLPNASQFFVVGNDLEYMSTLFDADVTAVSRSAFLGFKARNCKTVFSEYAVNGNMGQAIEPGQDMILDLDNAPDPRTRIQNAIDAKPCLAENGVFVMANLQKDVAESVAEQLKEYFTVANHGTFLIMRHPELGSPQYLSDFTPYSTAKIALVGNCQSSALASILYRVAGIKVDILVDINGEGSEAYQHAHWAVANTNRVDFCFSQPLGENFGDIGSNRLRDKYGDRYRQYTNLYFSGYHPDLTYFGDRTHRLQSAMGDYNSRIALIGYAKDIGIDATVSLFNNGNYERLNFYRQFEASQTELLRRDEDNDVKFASTFFDIARKHLPLYTVNHPTAQALAPLAEMIVEATGQIKPSIDISAAINPLAEGSIWPVYPEVARALNLEYAGNNTFYPTVHESRPPMSLRDFVAITFERYDIFGRERIMAMGGMHDFAAMDLE